ncbi:hypothetical protein [Microbulbifer sp. 2205BS26-8]|uniref:hypothetical protein n=1 Tax=Microbulbifer sp. 2205BS26-8 TaxID=3064386 RepID=UPI00273FA68F|nr:hypothetical protein [Microbulbifer sp. 2205BS26-8]MDP5209802.1 hypothetical protein [Microbulbifer sp. 2205BS26-8]
MRKPEKGRSNRSTTKNKIGKKQIIVTTANRLEAKTRITEEWKKFNILHFYVVFTGHIVFFYSKASGQPLIANYSASDNRAIPAGAGLAYPASALAGHNETSGLYPVALSILKFSRSCSHSDTHMPRVAAIAMWNFTHFSAVHEQTPWHGRNSAIRPNNGDLIFFDRLV